MTMEKCLKALYVGDECHLLMIIHITLALKRANHNEVFYAGTEGAPVTEVELAAGGEPSQADAGDDPGAPL